MGQMHATALATNAQLGAVQVGAGIRLTSPGNIDALRPRHELWVNVFGNDTTGDGSMGNPFTTIARAFAHIHSLPLPTSGYTVHLPSGFWQEDIAIPPDGTRLLGQGAGKTVLSGVGGTQLAWTETITDAGTRWFEGVCLYADIAGRDGGNISLGFFQSTIIGTLTLIGNLEMDGCDGDYSNFVNCSNVHVRNPNTNPLTVFSLSYDPTLGTNGPGSVYSEIVGGLWKSIVFNSQDGSVPLYVMGAKVTTSIVAQQAATIDAFGSVAPALFSEDAACVIAYDGSINDVTPSFHGNGSFKVTELILKKNVAINAGPADMIFAIPRLTPLPQLKSVFVTADWPGITANWLSNTATTLTLRVQAPMTHPAYEIRVLVRP